MTEWDAQAYNRVSALQQWLAEKSLVRLPLDGDERVLDVGCGDGKVTSEIARRLPRGSVVGVDASHAMIAFAAQTFPTAVHPNLAFRVADAARLPFADQFDLVVSFNCLHWVHDQAAVLRGIRAAFVASGRTHLRFVSRGVRSSAATTEFRFGWLVEPLMEAMAPSATSTPASAAFSTDAALMPLVSWVWK